MTFKTASMRSGLPTVWLLRSCHVLRAYRKYSLFVSAMAVAPTSASVDFQACSEALSACASPSMAGKITSSRASSLFTTSALRSDLAGSADDMVHLQARADCESVEKHTY